MPDNDEDFAAHDASTKIITEAVASLLPRFGPSGFPPEAIVEGAIRGAAVIAISLGNTANEFADILDDMAAGFRNLERPKLRLVDKQAKAN